MDKLKLFMNDFKELLIKHEFHTVALYVDGDLHEGYVLGMPNDDTNCLMIGSIENCPCCARESNE